MGEQTYVRVIPYLEMCQREGVSLQRGMNFRLKGQHSVVLMSVRAGAPYKDAISEDGTELIYEGHDVPRSAAQPYPKLISQAEMTHGGSLTENGKFHRAAQGYKDGAKGPDLVRVYEKIKAGIWTDNGYFELVDSWLESDGTRDVFKFKLLAIETSVESAPAVSDGAMQASPGRLIPTSVKIEVWARDQGRCVECGASDDLHFDHILPFSLGGTSRTAANIQLLCARHNLEKRAQIK